ncbi:Alpha/Beta hydrolase protein [Xylaria sp. FL1042]|nr:Alpha/Beta hydrolase protein [Xylaria sp. FL1042]
MVVPTAKSPPTIFFIPGAWHEIWVFDQLRAVLEARGFETQALDLPTIISNDPNLGLMDDAKFVHSALTTLADAGKEILILPHSYGGHVAANAVTGLGVRQRAAAGLQGGVLMIANLATMITPAGVCLLNNLGGKPLPWFGIGDDGLFTANGAMDLFYHDVKPELAAKAIAGLRRMSYRVVSDISEHDPWNNGIEVGYIFCKNDHSISLDAQKAMASIFPEGFFTATLESSHSPFFSIPEATADVIENAVEYARAKLSS